MNIVTHNGPFHADDVVAVALLKRLFPNAAVTRSRDPKFVAAADIAVDVGGSYIPGKVLDHHFKDAPSVDGVTLSSAGLVCQDFPGVLPDGVRDIVIADFIRAIDAGDNGLSNPVAVADANVNHFTFAHAISAFNPAFGDDPDFDGAFAKAVDFATVVIDRLVAQAAGQLAAVAIADAAIADADDPRILVLGQFAPVMDHVIDAAPNALFLVYPGANDGDWKVQAIPPVKGSFAQRCPLPTHLAGLRDDALKAASGIPDAIFVHPGRFIGGTGSRDTAIQLAKLAASVPD